MASDIVRAPNAEYRFHFLRNRAIVQHSYVAFHADFVSLIKKSPSEHAMPFFSRGKMRACVLICFIQKMKNGMFVCTNHSFMNLSRKITHSKYIVCNVLVWCKVLVYKVQINGTPINSVTSQNFWRLCDTNSYGDQSWNNKIFIQFGLNVVRFVCVCVCVVASQYNNGVASSIHFDLYFIIYCIYRRVIINNSLYGYSDANALYTILIEFGFVFFLYFFGFLQRLHLPGFIVFLAWNYFNYCLKRRNIIIIR